MFDAANQSPYLLPGRLADVIAAITVLGSYRYYKLSFEKAAERIVNDEGKADHWKKVFEEHPEFFRIVEDRQKVSLVWRRSLKKNFDPKRGIEISRDEFDQKTSKQKTELSRRPLSSEEITKLMDVAIRSHDRALEVSKHQKWWIPIAAASLGFVGALIGGIIS
ncbi:MAG: hypothetical protein Pars2KO_28890 [Parasphingorhabdus sp.]